MLFYVGIQKFILLLLGPCYSTVMCPPKKAVASAVIKVNCFLNGSNINKMLNNRIMQINKSGENSLTSISNLNLPI